MRSLSFVVALTSLLSSACQRDASGLAGERGPERERELQSARPDAAPAPERGEPVELPPAPTTAEPAASPTEGAPAEPEPVASDAGAQPSEPAGPSEPSIPSAPSDPSDPSDPLAPIMPSGPEPGSPEADAELAELLDESTLTQEEFDEAFRDGGPKLDGDQFVFGPNERTRKPPAIESQ
ncbi:hypothetical protein ENSA5_12490 [Enhygromyxa salina]|uniref:Uncharacterized protein n=1 Tax=Enhygromyxa salina TaxID=215803 RepID=A0A2S9YFJ7_9BACT|nr:hypothetical protein [Enhygromyxa salina]PRQ03880.1 hypothetical protein ENSA5_12490 [Enhygromyxa salina]